MEEDNGKGLGNDEDCQKQGQGGSTRQIALLVFDQNISYRLIKIMFLQEVETSVRSHNKCILGMSDVILGQ